jgi:hypothetical protein
MNDLILSYIRTYVPIGVGAVLSYLAVRFGVVVPEHLSTEATVVLTGAVIAGYYGIVRALEKRWPVFGRLLGSQQKPVYVEPRR